MKKNDIIVSTMPIKPQKETNVGMLFAPLISEIISEKIAAENVLSINLLHSYEAKDKLANVYIDSINKFGIKYNRVYFDKSYLFQFQQLIQELYDKNYIVEKQNVVFKCDCGKMHIASNGIRSFENGQLYEKVGDNYYCKQCGTMCRQIEELGLYLHLSEEVDDKIQIVPNYLQKEIAYFHNNLRGQDILISKNRNTGLIFRTNNGNEYNIDVDMLWMNYVQCFDETNQILIASNHQVYEMYLVNYINNMFATKKLCFIASPYMNKTELNIFEELYKYEDSLFRKICLLYSLKWKNKNCNWNQTVFKGIAKLGGEKRKVLYEYLINELSDYDFSNIDLILDSYFTNEVNMQKNLSVVKKLGGI